MKTIEIEKYKPCSEAVEFRKKFNSFKEAWEQCTRGDWMLWLAYKLEINNRILTLAKAMCAKTILHLIKDQRGIDAINTSTKYGKGKATQKELDEAAYKAQCAVDEIIHVPVDIRIYAATCIAAYCVNIDNNNTNSVTIANQVASCIGYNKISAKKENQLKTANICREILTDAVFEKLNIK